MFEKPAKEARLPSGVQMGFYYRYGYFLLPVGYSDFSQFLMALRQKGTPMEVDTIVLEENWEVDMSASYELGVSIAPYFITDYIDSVVTLSIEDADDVYPVMVELLTQKEYNDRLRTLVKDYCPGCSSYGGVDERDSSLSGHFGEISLNGVCVYRCESRRSPQVFMQALTGFARWWQRFGYSEAAADRMLDNLKDDLKLKYDSAEISEDGGVRTLSLSVKKSDIFLGELTRMVSEFVTAQADENYRILLNEAKPVDPAEIDALIEPGKIAATRKLLKKYGVSVGVLTYNAAHENKMADFMEGMSAPGRGPVRLMKAEPGRRVYLFTDTAEILRWLRYCSPVLQSMNTMVTVYDQDRTTRYRVSLDMEHELLDGAAPGKPASKKRLKKLAAEKGRVLNRQQVADMFTYIEIRLSSDGCDHTPRFAKIWLQEHLPEDQVEPALEEMLDMGGGCDCEIVMNCYEDYELE